jgi:hypothetical protein
MSILTANPSPTRHRLSNQEVATYRREGFYIIPQPIFPQEKFDALKNHFEAKLKALPAGERPEAMDVPHFTDPTLFNCLLSDEVLDLVEPILGKDIALFSSHFICKPAGNGKRVPWHEDSAYWRGRIDPMEVVTVWLAIDPSKIENGCMNVIPRTHHDGFSQYEPVDPETNVFANAIRRDIIQKAIRDQGQQVACELDANHASLHDGKIIHGSEPNLSSMRRCGYTMRFISTKTKYQIEETHQIYLARGVDHAGNRYADPSRSYPDLLNKRIEKKIKEH